MRKYTKRQILSLVIIAIANFCSAICVSLQAPFYPAEAEAKGATATEYGLVFGIFELVVFLVSPIYGEYVSNIGSKFMFNAGIFVTGSTCILFGFLNRINDTKPFIYLSFLVRIVEALGNAGFLTASFSIIAKEFEDDVGSTFAALETCFGVGLIAGPTVGGALYELGGYTLPFVCMGTTLLTAACVTFFLLPDSEGAVDKIHGDASMLQIFRVLAICLEALAIIAASISIGFVQATLEPHLRPLGLSPFQTGLIFVLNGATYAISAPIWGKLCDKYLSPKFVIGIGCLVVALAFMLIGPAPFIPFEPSIELIIVSLIIHGIGFGAVLVATFTGAHRDALKAGFPNNTSTFGVVSGMWTSCFALGAFIGPSCAGALMDTFGFDIATLFVFGLHIIVAVLVLVYMSCCTVKPLNQAGLYETLENELMIQQTTDTENKRGNRVSHNSVDSSYGSIPSYTATPASSPEEQLPRVVVHQNYQ